ncbi:hypothetical protein M9H77_21766 [Catharanthus roseus]|uniref:Uncharacterized protein n=1 Tax=Catharanthus roseus TaxID=4058 RepID=A0ACC0AN97_CATRO|nr:hypothetical protein M9H77_21766 [Catharanthus roseus]
MRGGANIQIRLDRAMANADWRMMFPNAMVSHLSAGTFDHRPILLNTSPANQCLPKPFRFTEIWTRDSSSYDIIRKAWNEPIERSPHFQLRIYKEGIGDLFYNFYENLFNSTNLEFVEGLHGLSGVQNDSAIPSGEEIKEVAFALKNGKILGPNGMTPKLYKAY